MGRCSVLACDSRRKQKKPGVTFHQFPPDELTLRKWLAAIGRKNWEPNKHSVICSKHFEEDSIRRVKKRYFIKRLAVPTLFLHVPSQNDSSVSEHNRNNDDNGHLNVSSPIENKHDPFGEDIKPEFNSDEPRSLKIPYPGNSCVVSTIRHTERPIEDQSIEDVIKNEDSGSNLEVCRVCLAVDCKMFRLKETLEQAYAQVTGIFVSSHDGLPQLLCWECAARVLSAVKLCDRAMKAHNILSSLLALQGSINMQHIHSINREQMKLMTSLSCEYFKQADHHNIIIETNTNIIEIQETDSSDDDTEIYLNTEEIDHEGEDNDDQDDDDKYESEIDQQDSDVNTGMNDHSADDTDSTTKDGDDQDDTYRSEIDQQDSYVNTGMNDQIADDTDSTTKDGDDHDQDDTYRSEIDRHDSDVQTDMNDQIADDTDSTTKNGDNQDDTHKSAIDQHENHVKTDMNDQIAGDTDSTMKDVASKKSIKKPNAKLKEPSKRIRQRKPKSDSNNKGSQSKDLLIKLQESFTISAVKLEDAIAAVQSRKQSEAYISALFKCELCCRGYPSETSYEKHALKHTEKFGNIECPVCKFRYKKKYALTTHMVLQHYNKYHCKQCDFATDSRIRAENHRNYHAGAQNKCPHCPKIFINKTSYYSHLRIHHACKFACNLCGHTFLSRIGVEKHKRMKHELDDSCAQDIEGRFCDTCDMRFATAEAYDKHLMMSSRHNHDVRLSEGNTYNADGATRPRGGRRRRPVARPVTCEQCGVTLGSVQSYAHHFRRQHPAETRAQHVARHRGVPAVCELCGKKFICMAVLKSHMSVHTGERFKCEDCGKSFTGTINLHQHRKIHEPSRPTYPCEICGRQYTHSGNLKRHIQSHINATPFECDACGKRVTTRAGLQMHIDHVHSGRPWPKRVRLRQRPTDTKTHRQ